MTHPLTDDIIHTMWGKGDPSQKFEYRLARSSADWQLEQVIECLNAMIFEDNMFFEDSLLSSDIECLPRRLREAMRPQQQEEN